MIINHVVKKTVGYIKALGMPILQNTEWYEMLGYDVEKMEPKDFLKGKSLICPAIQSMFKNLYIIRSPFNIHLKHHFLPDGSSTVQILQDSSFKPEKFNELFAINNILPHERNDPKKPILQFALPCAFLTDDDVIMEVLPPMLEYQKLPGLVSGGIINIQYWHRTVNWFFEWSEPDKEINIKRGDALFYLRFLPKDRDDTVILKKINQNDDINKSFKACYFSIQNLKSINDSLMSLNKINKPKYLMKTHFKIIKSLLKL